MALSEPTADRHHNQPPLSERLKIDFEAEMDQVEELARRANAVKTIVDDRGLTCDDDIEPMVEVGKAAAKLAISLKKTRLETTQPLRDDVATINGFFDVMTTRVERIKTAFAAKVGEYEDEKRARERREAAERARIAEEEARAKLQEAADSKHSVMGDVVMAEAAEAEQRFQKATYEAMTAGTGPTRTDAGTVSQSGKWTFAIEDASKIPLERLRPYIKIADLEKFLRAYVSAKKDTEPLPGVRIFQEQRTSFR